MSHFTNNSCFSDLLSNLFASQIHSHNTMSSNYLNLSAKEKEARDLFLTIYSAYDKPIDIGMPGDLKPEIPSWFDQAKFKRGQEFYVRNRFGIQMANFLGSVSLLADPAALDVIRMTNQSNTTKTARKRYVEALLHTMTWYGQDLKQDSASWKSLNRVRRLHLHAATQAMKKDIGLISQADVAMALYIFIGMTIGRPHNIGIAAADAEGREGFIHFWAVLGYMLGLEDQYNYCLGDMEVVEIIIDIFTRYFYMPNMQIETSNFKQSATAFCEAFDYFIGDISYGATLFSARRAIGVPGYQYLVDRKPLKIIKDIFTKDEISQILKYMSRNKHYQQFPDIYLTEHPRVLLKVDSDTKLKSNERFLSEKEQAYLGFDAEEIVVLRTVPYDQWNLEFNDSQFCKLSAKDQAIIKRQCTLIKYSGWFFVRWLTFIMTKYTEYRLWWWHGKNSKIPLY